MGELLSAFLSSQTVQDGVYQISVPRPFQHDEEIYDQHRPPEQCTQEFVRREGATLFSFFRKQGYRDGGAILEIGCGSGWMSAALASQSNAGHLLVTDPSPAFCRMTRRRLPPETVAAPRVDCGLLRAEDVKKLPRGAVSLIFLRSVLHHITDVDDFLARCSSVLLGGGLLICEEPYYDGYVMMGFLAQFIPDAMTRAGDSCTAEELKLVDLFIATMQYYARRDLDKSAAEDKHLFRPDELSVSAGKVQMSFAHHANWHVTISAEENIRNRIGYFQRFFEFYIRRCMNWPPAFCDRVTAATARYFQYFAPLESEKNTVPYCFGAFVFTRNPPRATT